MNHRKNALKLGHELLTDIWLQIPFAASVGLSIETRKLFPVDPFSDLNKRIQIEQRLGFLNAFHAKFHDLPFPETHRIKQIRRKEGTLVFLSGKIEGMIQFDDNHIAEAGQEMDNAENIYNEISTLLAEECTMTSTFEKIGTIPLMPILWGQTTIEEVTNAFDAAKYRVLSQAQLNDPGWPVIENAILHHRNVLQMLPTGQQTLHFCGKKF